MAERTEERTRDHESETDTSWTDVDVEGLLTDETESSRRSPNPSADKDGEERSKGGFRARLRDRRRGLFSPRLFAGLLVFALVVGVVGGAVPVIGRFAGVVGVFAAAFGVGLASSGRHYLETGLAGAGAAGLTLLLTVVTSINIVFFEALGDVGPELGVIGAGAGLLAGIVGHYFGRDLRNGLTTDL